MINYSSIYKKIRGCYIASVFPEPVCFVSGGGYEHFVEKRFSFDKIQLKRDILTRNYRSQEMHRMNQDTIATKRG